MSDSTPTLWHLEVSHYSEKARWALTYKGIDHKRRTIAAPGLHIPAALWMTRGAHYTYPVLELDGRKIGDSTAIIAALEERFSEPALYPSDPEERRRALELEEYFDEELGPAARTLPFHELGEDPELFQEVIRRTAPEPLAKLSGPASVYARAYTKVRFKVGSREGAEQARAKLLEVLDRMDDELGSGDYLVGDGFSVADLTAASLFYPIVVPEGGPLPTDAPTPEGLASFRASIEERRGIKFVHEMYKRHRRPVSAPAASAA
jgi:glutathione S-transferase